MNLEGLGALEDHVKESLSPPSNQITIDTKSKPSTSQWRTYPGSSICTHETKTQFDHNDILQGFK